MGVFQDYPVDNRLLLAERGHAHRFVTSDDRAAAMQQGAVVYTANRFAAVHMTILFLRFR